MKISPWAGFFLPTAIAILAPSTSFGQTTPSSAAFVNNLMPQPASLSAAPGRFLLTPQFSASTTAFHNSRLDAAIGETMHQLRQKTGVSFAEQSASGGPGSQLTIAVQGAGEEIQSVDEDESYTLSVTPTGSASRPLPSSEPCADCRHLCNWCNPRAANTSCRSSPSAIRHASHGEA